MRFLLDAHLPGSLAAVLMADGHEVIHTSQLPAQNNTPDAVINELSMREQRVVITKDSDFYHSHLLYGKPWKLLIVRTGNIRTHDIQRLFEIHLPAILSALAAHSLVEVDRQSVRIVR
jgi:predicted nuclease of predicted toxin-antitoxin system